MNAASVGDIQYSPSNFSGKKIAVIIVVVVFLVLFAITLIWFATKKTKQTSFVNPIGASNLNGKNLSSAEEAKSNKSIASGENKIPVSSGAESASGLVSPGGFNLQLSQVSNEEVKKVYQMYCAEDVSPVFPDKNDTSKELIKKLGDASMTDLTSNLLGKKYSNSEIPTALHYMGFKLMSQDKFFDDSVRFYYCASSKYYDQFSMYRMAQVYKNGSDMFSKQVPGIIIEKKLEVDMPRAFFWVSASLYLEIMTKSGILDPSTSQIGWNTIAMLDDMQNRHDDFDQKGAGDEAVKFVIKRYAGFTGK